MEINYLIIRVGIFQLQLICQSFPVKGNLAVTVQRVNIDHLAVVCLGFKLNLRVLLRGFFCGWGGGEVKLRLKIIRIMLETSNLACKYTHICSFRKYTSQYQDPLNFADVSFSLKDHHILAQNSTFPQSNSMRAVLKIFQLCFQFF